MADIPLLLFMCQGLMLDCSQLDWEPLEDFPPAENSALTDGGRPPVWLALDEIGDPVRTFTCAMLAYSSAANANKSAAVSARPGNVVFMF